MPTLRKSNSGFTLLETVVSLGVIALAAYAGSSGVSLFSKGIRHVELRGQESDLKRYLSSEISCEAIMAQNSFTCGGSGFIQLRNDSCQTITNASYQGSLLFNRFKVRARCLSNNSSEAKIEIHSSRVSADNTNIHITDPLTGKKGWKRLYSQPITCKVQHPYIVKYGNRAATFIQELYGINNNGWNISIAASETNYDQLCRELGYSHARHPLPDGQTYSSPGDNGILFWNTLEKKWELHNAAAAGNPRHFGHQKLYCVGAQNTNPC